MRGGGERYVLLHFTVGGEQLANAFCVNVEAVVLGVDDNRGLNHVACTESLFVLLVGKDVLASDHSLGRAVFARLGSGECSNFARELALHHEEGARFSATSFNKNDVCCARVALNKFVVTHL